MIKVGVIGCGYWGPNLIRNFRNTAGCQMVICCDMQDDRLDRVKSLFPGIQTTKNHEDLLNSDLDAVAIATPVWTHHPLAKAFLEAGKHVFVEKTAYTLFGRMRRTDPTCGRAQPRAYGRAHV